MKITAPDSRYTDFTRDTVGRYTCNGLDEALKSTPQSPQNPTGTTRADARDFDLIILGGGTFGSALAEHMWFRDKARYHRILVLEAGPFLLAEHQQNLPLTRVDVADKTSIQNLRDQGKFGWDKPQKEVWGLPWHANQEYPGLAYCIGGRSLYWGGWSPELLETETTVWPPAVVNDLRARYFNEASAQIGVTETNDFVFGDLHSALRELLFSKLNTVTDAIPLNDPKLLDHPGVRYAGKTSTSDLAGLLGLDATKSVPTDAEMKARLKLEAPLAVQGRTGHAGFFPMNKFSTVPLLMKAARFAYEESINAHGQSEDIHKRLMVVPFCHANRLVTVRDGAEWRVVGVETNQGTVSVPTNGKVIVAMATIESTRLALNSFRDIHPDAYARIGNNLMAHLRSNLDIRVPRTAIAGLSATVKALQTSALFVKGRHEFKNASGNVAGVAHFHLQISASGGNRDVGSEAELFKKIPDIDTLDNHIDPLIPDSHVAITIRGIGEMQSQNPRNTVKLDSEIEPETGTQRVFVNIDDPRAPELRTEPKVARDGELWGAMDSAAKDVAKIFGGSALTAVPDPKRDTLGTTHHETGTLWMGDTPDSVTDVTCKFRHITNAYAAGPALFPTIGSPNPMLTGIALARRLGDLLATPSAYVAPDGATLFNGFDLTDWRMTTIKNQPGKDNPGYFRVINGTLEAVGGKDMGILWHTKPTPENFVLRLQWLRWTDRTNSGVYVRFPDPDSKGYNNTAFVADDFGFEVQIDEFGDIPVHRTGAVYRKDNRTDGETLTQKPACAIGEWNDYEIRVNNQIYSVKLNGDTVCVFDNTGRYPNRGLASIASAPAFIGLQCYADPNSRVAFRNIRIEAFITREH
jgi:choline dehydrogenase-like flavoprotein